MGTLRFFEEVVSFKIRRTFGFADYTRSEISAFVLSVSECAYKNSAGLLYKSG